MKVLLNNFHLNGHTLGFHPDSKGTTTLIDSRFDSGSERVKKLFLRTIVVVVVVVVRP